MIGDDALTRLLLGPGPSGYGTAVVQTMHCESWDPATNHATVRDAFTRYTGCALLTSALPTMGTGPVLVLNVEGVRPVVLGRLTVPTTAG